MKTPADLVIDLFDGIRPLARLLQKNPSTIWAWQQKRKGLIPSKHHRRLLKLARKHGVTLSATDLVMGR
jgi:hypothetical protein